MKGAVPLCLVWMAHHRSPQTITKTMLQKSLPLVTGIVESHGPDAFCGWLGMGAAVSDGVEELCGSSGFVLFCTSWSFILFS